jgi:hypothetical protein
MTAESKMGVLLSLRTGSVLHGDTFWVPENLLAKEYRALLPALSVRNEQVQIYQYLHHHNPNTVIMMMMMMIIIIIIITSNHMAKCSSFILRIVQGFIPNLYPGTLCILSY